MRKATIERKTTETEIKVNLNIDGSGVSKISTGIPFFDHMLTLFAKHGLFDLEIIANGDIEIDFHHTVEDIGIVLGEALTQALGNKAGIRRYGFWILPMDESLATVAIDLSGRAALVFNGGFNKEKVGAFDAELIEEFFKAFTNNAKLALHIKQEGGSNLHHQIEAIFKALGRALDSATQFDERVQGIPSSKGVI